MPNSFIGSDSVQGFTIGATNNPNAIQQGEIYPICSFPGADFSRRLTFSQPVVFNQSQRNVIELVNEAGQVVFSFDTGNIDTTNDRSQSQEITVSVPATEAEIQTLGVRWVSRGGAFMASFSGNIFVYQADEAVIWA